MCTDDELNDWLRYKAAEQQHIERCFVVCSQGHDEVDAFYTLTGHRLVREATDATEGQLPALIVSRLAVGWGQQHTGMGALLLVDALKRVVSASEVDGASVCGRPSEERARRSASTSTMASAASLELTGWSSGSPTWRPHWTRDPRRHCQTQAA